MGDKENETKKVGGVGCGQLRPHIGATTDVVLIVSARD